jgi:hypothetical protein
MGTKDVQRAVSFTIERGSGAEPPFYAVSTAKFCILSLSTLGLYDLYWFYRNWARISEHSGKPLRPFWRAFFSPLYCHPLALSVNSAAESLHLSERLPGAGLAIAYVVVLALHRLPDPYWMLSMLAFLPLVPIQRRILEIHEAIAPGRDTTAPGSARSVAAAGVGSLLAGLMVLSAFGPATRALPAAEIPAAYVDTLVGAGILDPDEELEYFYSAGLFSILEDGNLFTDRRVISYETRDGELSLAAASYDEIRDIEVQYSTNALEDSLVTVATHDGDAFPLLVSAEDGRDKEFVARLEQHLAPQQLEAAAP